jgi:hypothetical protein
MFNDLLDAEFGAAMTGSVDETSETAMSDLQKALSLRDDAVSTSNTTTSAVMDDETELLESTVFQKGLYNAASSCFLVQSKTYGDDLRLDFLPAVVIELKVWDFCILSFYFSFIQIPLLHDDNSNLIRRSQQDICWYTWIEVRRVKDILLQTEKMAMVNPSQNLLLLVVVGGLWEASRKV